MALELESHQLASKQKTQFAREPQQEEGHPVQQQQIADHRTRVLGMFFSSWWKLEACHKGTRPTSEDFIFQEGGEPV